MTKRLILGGICIICALVFMVYSLLQPKTQRIIKPSALKSPVALGYYMHRQLIPKISDDATFIFYIKEPLEKNIKLIEAFLNYGSENENRAYKIFSDLELNLDRPYEKTSIKEFASQLNKENYEEPEDILTSSNLSLVYISKQKNYFDSEVRLASGVKNNIHRFFSYTLNEELKSYKCKSWKKAFLIRSQEDLDCFARKSLSEFQKKEKSLEKPVTLYAFEQIRTGFYIYYYYPL